jgi:hypothetical protein
MKQTDLYKSDKKTLKEFGLVMAGAISGVFGVLLPWLFDREWSIWPWPLAALFLAAALVYPLALRYLFVGWMWFGHLLSRITTPLILGIIFYLVITPFGLIRGALGKNSMTGKDNGGKGTYRVNSQQPDDEHMERPF